jgi:hypothetical protein
MSLILLSLTSDLPVAGLVQLTGGLKGELLRAGFSEPQGLQGQGIGEKGDPITLGAIALAAFGSGGVVVTFIKCMQAIFARDHSLRITVKFPKGAEIAVDAKNIASKDLQTAIEAAVAAARVQG